MRVRLTSAAEAELDDALALYGGIREGGWPSASSTV